MTHSGKFRVSYAVDGPSQGTMTVRYRTVEITGHKAAPSTELFVQELTSYEGKLARVIRWSETG